MPPPLKLHWWLRKIDEEESATCLEKRRDQRQSLSQFPVRFQSILAHPRSIAPRRAGLKPVQLLHAAPLEIQRIQCPNRRPLWIFAHSFPRAARSLSSNGAPHDSSTRSW